VGTPHGGRLNYEKRLKEMEMMTETIPTATCSTESTEDIVQRTSKYLAPRHNMPMQQQILVYDTQPQVTHPVASPSTHSFYSNESYVHTSSSLVDDIAAIAKLETEEDAIIIAQDEITYLNDLSLEGDIDDDVSL
jgi:hypothetical protein